MAFGHSQRRSARVADKKTSVSDYCGRLYFSPLIKYTVPSFFVAILFVSGMYLAVEIWLSPQDSLEVISTCHLDQSYYVSCVPNGIVNDSENCLRLACCWREDLKLCYHAFPSRYGYKIQGYTNSSKKEGTLVAVRETSPFGTVMNKVLKFHIEEINDCCIRISLVTDEKKSSRRKKINYSWASEKAWVGCPKMVAHLQESQFAVTLRREKDSSVILSTGRGALIVTDTYWEWTLYLSSTGGLYGLQHLEFNGQSRDWIYNSENASLRPAFLAIDAKGNAASCYLEYTGPLEVEVLNVSKLVILRGVSVPPELRLVVMSGVNGLEASRQLASLYNAPSPTLTATSLGLHLCPESEEQPEALAEIARRMTEARAPWDSHCMHRRLGFSLEHGADLAQVAEARGFLAKQGRTLSPHLTPMLFDKPRSELRVNLEREMCLLRNWSDVYSGLDGNRSVVYPDWGKAKTRELLRSSLNKYMAELLPDFLILRDSWPKDDTKHLSLPDSQHFDYLPEDALQLLSGRSLPWDLEAGKHYARHNAYAQTFLQSITEADVPAVQLAHHRSNSNSDESTDSASWQNLRSLFTAGLVSSMLGQLPPAMYICAAGGGENRLNDELCLRWYGLAVAWPHVLTTPDKSPGGDKLGRLGAARAAKLLRLRASLATYQRTALAKYALDGSPVFAATSLLYPEERQPRHTTGTQLLWGDALLIGLILAPKRSQLWMWIPGKYAWRHLQDGLPEQPTGEGTVSVLASVGQIVTLVRPGHIVPLHDSESEALEKSTASALTSSLSLLANGICESEKLHSCQAEGSIYYGGENAKKGAFLEVQLVNATLVLKNLKSVRSALRCDDKHSDTRSGSRILESLRLLNNASQFEIGNNLCDCSQDTWILHLNDQNSIAGC